MPLDPVGIFSASSLVATRFLKYKLSVRIFSREFEHSRLQKANKVNLPLIHFVKMRAIPKFASADQIQETHCPAKLVTRGGLAET